MKFSETQILQLKDLLKEKIPNSTDFFVGEIVDKIGEVLNKKNFELLKFEIFELIYGT
ncbi:MAG: hypothetical protein PHN31_00805 [Candidatus Gracilibacteria bacterium]|nr:hypothetical protein [Candidatus Gracilibacteria bacterium]